MDNYNNMLEGKIIAINNFIFEDNKLDHAWNTGRLCVIIYSDNEYEYVLPITHSIKNNNSAHYYFIDGKNLKCYYSKVFKESTLQYNHKITSKNKRDLNGYINLKNIYKIPIAFRSEIAKLDYNSFKGVVSKMNYYHCTKTLEETIDKAIVK